MTATHTIGLVFSAKKYKQSRLTGISERARSSGLRFVELDLTRPIEDQMPIDIIVHKVSDLISKVQSGDPAAKAQYERLQDFCSRHPSVRIIDPFENVAKLLDRQSALDVCAPDLDLFRIPRSTQASNVNELHAVDLKFPIFCKRQSACAVSGSHHMALVPSASELPQLQQHFGPDDAVILQEFVPHDGVLVKVYVVYPDQTFIFLRPSFKNMDTGLNKAHFFDSQKLPKVFGADAPEQQHIMTDPVVRERVEAKVDSDRIKHIAAHLQRRLGLTFFGFDVLLASTTGEYYVIDINYFPSFQEIKDFPDLFVDTLKARIETPSSSYGNSK